jgi:glutamate carboxypeptidase
MKGGISVMLAALRAFEDHPDNGNLGYRVLLSPDEEIGSLASGPVLARLAQGGHVGLTYEPAMAGGALAARRGGSGKAGPSGRVAGAGGLARGGGTSLPAATPSRRPRTWRCGWPRRTVSVRG